LIGGGTNNATSGIVGLGSSISRVACEGCTGGSGRERLSLVDTSKLGIAGISVARIGFIAEVGGLRRVDTNVLGGIVGVDCAGVISTLILIIAVSSSLAGNTLRINVFNHVTSGGSASVGEASGVGRRGHWCVDTSLLGITRVSEALITLLTRGRGISGYTLVVAGIRGVNGTLDGVAACLKGTAISVGLARRGARAQVGVNSGTIFGVASVTSARGVGLDRVDDLFATTLSTIGSGITGVSMDSVPAGSGIPASTLV
jgi:hypothetical protein